MEITEVTSRDRKVSFIASYHPPRFMSRKFTKEVNGNEGGHGKPWPVIFLILWLSSWKEKKLQVSLPSWYFCIPFQINPVQKMAEDLKEINLGGFFFKL